MSFRDALIWVICSWLADISEPLDSNLSKVLFLYRHVPTVMPRATPLFYPAPQPSSNARGEAMLAVVYFLRSADVAACAGLLTRSWHTLSA